MIRIGNDWDELIKNEISKEYFVDLEIFLENEYKNNIIYPPKDDIYNALRYTSYENTKVVILGQDPYIRKNQAHGLSFSVNRGIKIPSSLQNIYKEIKSDINIDMPNHGFLLDWTKEGVLLLNSVMTVQEGISNSHKGKGFETFTDNIISLLNNKSKPVVFILWGNYAKKKEKLITNPIHLVLTSGHPSFANSHKQFFSNNHFSKTNNFLKANNIKPINWKIL